MNSENEEKNEAVADASVPANEENVPANEENVPAGEENSGADGSVPADAGTKKPRRRWLKRLLIALAALVVIALLAVAFLLGPIVKFGANTFGASLLGVDRCEIGDAKIYPFSGYARFEKILIGKPIAEDVSFSDDVFSVDLVEIDFDMSTLFSQKKILEHFEIRKISANYEQLIGGQTNVDVIMKNLLGEPKEDSAEPEPESAPAKDDDADAPEEIFIGARYFVIADVNVGATLRGMPIAFPSMSSDFSEGIGIDEDLTPLAFGMKIAGNFMSVIDFFRDSVLGDAAGAAIGAVSDAAGATADAVSDAAGATADAVSGAAGAVVGFFTGDDSDDDDDAEKDGNAASSDSDGED